MAPPEPDELRHLCERGHSDTEIGKLYGVSDKTVMKWRHMNGIRPGRRATNSIRPSVDILRALVASGTSHEVIAKRYGVTAKTAYRWRNALIKGRTPKFKPGPAPKPYSYDSVGALELRAETAIPGWRIEAYTGNVAARHDPCVVRP
jgi:transposase